MKIITFEGMDKSGKHTASVKLAEYLKKQGYRVVQSEFHRYDTPTGKLIQEYLYDRYKVSNETIQYIMLADKEAQQGWFKELDTEKIDYLILDRYYLSLLAYSNYFLHKSDLSEEKKEYYRNIYGMGVLCFEQSDITIYLDNSAETSMERKGQHGENDKYESNKELLNFVRNQYLDLIQEETHYAIVSSEQDIDQVHKEVIEQFEILNEQIK